MSRKMHNNIERRHKEGENLLWLPRSFRDTTNICLAMPGDDPTWKIIHPMEAKKSFGCISLVQKGVLKILSLGIMLE